MTSFVPHELEWTPEKVASLWDYFAANPAYRMQYFSAHSGAPIVARADRELGLRGKRVLDFGCGRGDLLAALFARGVRARGLEFSGESAQTTNARFAGEPEFQGVVVVEDLPSPLPDGSADVVFLVEVVEHLLEDQLAPTLREVRRLLAPGGVVFATCPNHEDLDANRVRCPDCGAVFHRWQHVRSLDARSIAALFEPHGFRTRAAEGVWWGATPLVRLRTRLRRPLQPAPKPHLLYLAEAI